MDAATKAGDGEALVKAMYSLIGTAIDNMNNNKQQQQQQYGLTALVEKALLANGSSIGSADEAATSLAKYEAVKIVLQRGIVAIDGIITQTRQNQALLDAKTSISADIVLTIPDLSFMEPRGRFKMVVSKTSIFLEGKNQSFLYPLSKISHMSCVPSNASLKKEGEDFFSIRFTEPIVNNGKEGRGLLCTLGKNLAKQISSADGNHGIESDVVTKVFQSAVSTISIIRPQSLLFMSILQRKPFLRCYKGTQEGVIYPLENGVLFIKPSLFIPAEEIASLSAGRGGSAGNTRYVDLTIDTVSGPEYEFTNIDRDELPSLQLYVKGYLEAMQRKKVLQSLAASDGGGSTDANVNENGNGDEGNEGETGEAAHSGCCSTAAVEYEDDEDDSDDDDDDYDPDESDSDDCVDSDDNDGSSSSSEEDGGNPKEKKRKKLSKKEKAKLLKKKKKKDKKKKQKRKRKRADEEEEADKEEKHEGGPDGDKEEGKSKKKLKNQTEELKSKDESVATGCGTLTGLGVVMSATVSTDCLTETAEDNRVGNTEVKTEPTPSLSPGLTGSADVHSTKTSVATAASSSGGVGGGGGRQKSQPKKHSSSSSSSSSISSSSTATAAVTVSASGALTATSSAATPPPICTADRAPTASTSASVAPATATTKTNSSSSSSSTAPGAPAPRQKTLQSFFGGGR